MKKLVVLGSTGSIGTQTLDIVRSQPGEFEIIGLSAHENEELLARQAREFKPRYVLQTAMSENSGSALSSLAAIPDADMIVIAVSGHAGLAPLYAALKAGKRVALANKEAIVMAGELLMDVARESGAAMRPIDSEPSAIWQALGMPELPLCNGDGGRIAAHPAAGAAVEKIILTASGGPFWKWQKSELERVTAAQAVKHPTWRMGEKISVDSATLMNKAFEIIEARWLFGIVQEKIDVTVHRQSIIHSFVQFVDGNIAAILAAPDMRIPISLALNYPLRAANSLPRLDFSQLQFTFERPDYSLFEGPRLAYEVLREGGIMPAVFCIADEIAVGKFLRGEIPFLGIYDFIKRSLDKVKNTALTMDALDDVIAGAALN